MRSVPPRRDRNPKGTAVVPAPSFTKGCGSLERGFRSPACGGVSEASAPQPSTPCRFRKAPGPQTQLQTGPDPRSAGRGRGWGTPRGARGAGLAVGRARWGASSSPAAGRNLTPNPAALGRGLQVPLSAPPALSPAEITPCRWVSGQAPAPRCPSGPEPARSFPGGTSRAWFYLGTQPVCGPIRGHPACTVSHPTRGPA